WRGQDGGAVDRIVGSFKDDQCEVVRVYVVRVRVGDRQVGKFDLEGLIFGYAQRLLTSDGRRVVFVDYKDLERKRCAVVLTIVHTQGNDERAGIVERRRHGRARVGVVCAGLDHDREVIRIDIVGVGDR